MLFAGEVARQPHCYAFAMKQRPMTERTKALAILAIALIVAVVGIGLVIVVFFGWFTVARVETRVPPPSLTTEAVEHVQVTTEPTEDTENHLSGRVVRVFDGDTIVVLVDNEERRVRLEGIGTPEMNQPFGKKAKAFTSEKCFGKTVTLIVSGEDGYGRLLGDVLVDGSSVNRDLLAAGLAWHYKQYNQDEELAALEDEARAAGRGLWGDKDAVPPWEWGTTPRSQ